MVARGARMIGAGWSAARRHRRSPRFATSAWPAIAPDAVLPVLRISMFIVVVFSVLIESRMLRAFRHKRGRTASYKPRNIMALLGAIGSRQDRREE